jgi:hypothetical protein
VWSALRLVKWVGFALWSAGCFGAFGPDDLAVRRRWAYRWATPGFFLLWMAGWGLAREAGRPLSTPWIAVAMATSLVQLQLVAWGVEREGRGLGWGRALSVGLFATTVWAMTLRPGEV